MITEVDYCPMTGDLPKERREITPRMVLSALLLTDIDDVEISTIESWSKEQQEIAWEWAMRVHFHACDNDDVELIPEPPHVAVLPRFKWK